MSYDVHFLHCDDGQDWLDALEEQEHRARRAKFRTTDAVRREWWRVATRVYREIPGGELRHRQQMLRYRNSDQGLQLELGADGVSMSLPYVHDEATARAALRTARRIADIVEEETQLRAFDPQLGGCFLQHGGSIARAANMMAATRRYLSAAAEGATPPLPSCVAARPGELPASSATGELSVSSFGLRPLRD